MPHFHYYGEGFLFRVELPNIDVALFNVFCLKRFFSRHCTTERTRTRLRQRIEYDTFYFSVIYFAPPSARSSVVFCFDVLVTIRVFFIFCLCSFCLLFVAFIVFFLAFVFPLFLIFVLFVFFSANPFVCLWFFLFFFCFISIVSESCFCVILCFCCCRPFLSFLIFLSVFVFAVFSWLLFLLAFPFVWFLIRFVFLVSFRFLCILSLRCSSCFLFSGFVCFFFVLVTIVCCSSLCCLLFFVFPFCFTIYSVRFLFSFY